MADKDFMDSLRTGHLVEDGDQPWQWYSPSEYAVKPRVKAKTDHRAEACAALRRLVERLKTRRFTKEVALQNTELADLSPEAIKIYVCLSQGFDPQSKNTNTARYRKQVFETPDQRRTRMRAQREKNLKYWEESRERNNQQKRKHHAERSREMIVIGREQRRQFDKSELGRVLRNAYRRRRTARLTDDERKLRSVKRREREARRLAFESGLIDDVIDGED